jgi:hypothetical protein
LTVLPIVKSRSDLKKIILKISTSKKILKYAIFSKNRITTSGSKFGYFYARKFIKSYFLPDYFINFSKVNFSNNSGKNSVNINNLIFLRKKSKFWTNSLISSKTDGEKFSRNLQKRIYSKFGDLRKLNISRFSRNLRQS